MHPEADVPPEAVPTTRREARRLSQRSDPVGSGLESAPHLAAACGDVSGDATSRDATLRDRTPDDATAGDVISGDAISGDAIAGDRTPASRTPRRRTVVRVGAAALGTAGLAAVTTVLTRWTSPGPSTAGTSRALTPESAPATTPAGSASAPATPGVPPPTKAPEPSPEPSQPGREEVTGPPAPKDRDDSLTQAEPEPPAFLPVDPPLPRLPEPARPGDPAAPASPQPPPGTLPLPVADTVEARRHLLRRAGIAVGDEALREVESAGLNAWLARQLDPSVEDDIEPVLRSWYPASYLSIDEARAALSDEGDATAASATEQATLARRLFGSRQIFEQVVDVFANTLNVPPMYGDSITWSVADYHRTVIRAHALGRYADMLHAAARHPAMMVVLDNRRSTAADVNENYGRELLELHTVGYGAYTEQEVRSSSMIMSGRRIAQQAFSWEPEHHALGPVSVLGFSDENSSAEAGLELGDRYIQHLAHHPRTAQTIARKLAVRFVSDRPSAELVERLAAVYLTSDTDIRAVMTALFCSEEFWSSERTKLRRPSDDLAGVIRCIGMTIERTTVDEVRHMFWTVDNLGDAPLRWGPPNGYPDVAEAWLGAGQIAGRWDHHRELVNGDRLTFAPSDAFLERITPAAGQTAGGWADQVSRVVLGAPVDERDREAVTTFLGVPADAVLEPRHVHQRASVAALLFDSPRYLLR